MESGKCGENLTWTLNDEGTLTISGTGHMDNYWNNEYNKEEFARNPQTPWRRLYYDIKKVVIEEGVTSIGENAFFCCSELKTLTLPESVKWIGADAFLSCESLTEITFPTELLFIGGIEVFRYCDSLKRIYYPEGSSRMKNFLSGSGNRVATFKSPLLKFLSNAYPLRGAYFFYGGKL